MGKCGNSVRFLFFFGSKVNADGDCSTKLRHLLLGRISMTNLDSVLKSRDITLPTKVCLVKDRIFPVVMYRCEIWTTKKTEWWRIDASELWCWTRHLRVPCTARKSAPNIYWKDWCWSWSSNPLVTWWKEPTHWKRLRCWERLKARGVGGHKGWDGWMASLTQWTWVWANSGR